MESISRLTLTEYKSFQKECCSICPNCSTLQVPDKNICRWCFNKTIAVKDAVDSGLILLVDKYV
jgi:uncharacterized OB-fold protein